MGWVGAEPKLVLVLVGRKMVAKRGVDTMEGRASTGSTVSSTSRRTMRSLDVTMTEVVVAGRVMVREGEDGRVRMESTALSPIRTTFFFGAAVQV